jgi:beta-phosphoglucomutase-like phosphatase (HAD superfamily)
MPDTAVFDVDGTLVDTNYQHALAWLVTRSSSAIRLQPVRSRTTTLACERSHAATSEPLGARRRPRP